MVAVRSRFSRRQFLRFGAAALAVPAMGFASGCGVLTQRVGDGGGATLALGIGTQDTTTNTVTGGVVLKELGLLEKHLPRTGRYEGVRYDISWFNSPSAPPLTNQMLAGKLQIAMMADYPALINGARFQEGYSDQSRLIATLGYNAEGSGNGIVVPTESRYQVLTDLEDATLSAPVGTAAHGMTIKAMSNRGLSEGFLDLINQPPDVSGAALQAGTVDAVSGFVPFPELFTFQGFARKLYDGSATNLPTFHSVLALDSFAREHPEVVVGYLRAVMEANDWVSNNPREAAEKIFEWTDIDKEVVYIILGRGGIMTLDPTIKPEWVETLKYDATVLRDEMGIIGSMDVDSWVKDDYIRTAFEREGRDYDELLQSMKPHARIEGRDAISGVEIMDQNLAGEIWAKGLGIEPFATPAHVLEGIRRFEADGTKILASYVTDYESCTKVFADKAFYVQAPEVPETGGPGLAAFATRGAAQRFARQRGSEVTGYRKAVQRL